MLGFAMLVFSSTSALAAEAYAYHFSIAGNNGYGTLQVDDLGGGVYWATSGNLIVTAGSAVGEYALDPVGPVTALYNYFTVNNLLYPDANPYLDINGLSFSATGIQINLFGDTPGVWLFAWRREGDARNTYMGAEAGDNFALEAAAVPEPESLAILALGLGLMAWGRRRATGAK